MVKSSALNGQFFGLYFKKEHRKKFGVSGNIIYKKALGKVNEIKSIKVK